MDEKRVLVTGVGGNVGQGIIRNIKNTSFNIKVIGTNIDDFSAGNHLCDLFYKVPYANSPNYIESVINIVKAEKVDLILPATDLETYYLSANKDKIPCEIAVSSMETTANYLDKYATFLHLKKNNVSFASSFLPSHYDGSFKDFILKPRQGRGSRNLYINPKNYKDFDDKDYMIQELHKGKEITIAFYVNKKQELHGFIVLERVLDNGMTTHCKVIKDYDEAIEILLWKLIKSSTIMGSANLQAIVTDENKIEPFEINCRISGTNSIRSNFGFKDVEYTLKEYLFNQIPSKPEIRSGIATRIMMDVIYTDTQDFDRAQTNSSKHYIY